MGLKYDEINKADFIELLNDLDNVSNTYKSSKLHDCYMEMIVDKLCLDTDLRFSYRSGGIVSESLGISISSSEIVSYDSVISKIEKLLVEKEKENQNEFGVNPNKLASEWGYSFSHSDTTAFYNTHDRNWTCWSDYSQKLMFELFYFGVFGEYHTDCKFSNELSKKYLEGDDWNKPKAYRGKVDELNGLTVAFMKNGKISVKTNDEEFWKRIEFFYDVCDPNFKNHRK